MNLCAAYLGPPGCGKSHLLAQHLAADARAAYVLAADPARSLVGQRAASLADLQAQLARSPAGVHCLDQIDGRQHLRAARAVAQASPRGCILAIDEVCAWYVPRGNGLQPLMSASYLDPELGECLLTRRHLTLGWRWGTQRTGIVHPAFWDSATEIYAWQLPPRAVAPLEAAGVPADWCRAVTRLELLPHDSRQPRREGRHFLHWRR